MSKPHACITITVEATSDYGKPYQLLYELHENISGSYADDVLHDVESRLDDASHFIRQLAELAEAAINALDGAEQCTEICDRQPCGAKCRQPLGHTGSHNCVVPY